MKKQIISLIKSLGYDVKKIKSNNDDLGVYKHHYSEESILKKRFYNIGAGNFFHPYWTNIDFYSDWYYKKRSFSGIHHDLMSLKELPIENDSAEIIYSSHTIEHISNSAAQKMFLEAYRALKNDGVLRITAPNIDLDYRALNDKDRNYFNWTIKIHSNEKVMEKANLKMPLSQASLEQLFLFRFAANVTELHSDGAKERISDRELKNIFLENSYEDALNYCVTKCDFEIQSKYPGNHINWWNPSKIKKMLEIAGFSKIFVSGYGQSFSPVLRNVSFFDNTHPKVSFYMEAFK